MTVGVTERTITFESMLEEDVRFYFALTDRYTVQQVTDLDHKLNTAGVTIWGGSSEAPLEGEYEDCVVFYVNDDGSTYTVRLSGNGEVAANAFQEIMAPIWKEAHRDGVKDVVTRAITSHSGEEILQLVRETLAEHVHRV